MSPALAIAQNDLRPLVRDKRAVLGVRVPAAFGSASLTSGAVLAARASAH
jgi:hypothetical protein